MAPPPQPTPRGSGEAQTSTARRRTQDRSADGTEAAEASSPQRARFYSFATCETARVRPREAWPRGRCSQVRGEAARQEGNERPGACFSARRAPGVRRLRWHTLLFVCF